jgi:putative chitinase
VERKTVILEAEWMFRLCKLGVPSGTAATWAPIFERYMQADMFGLGNEEMADFISQVLHESAMLTRLEENMDYRAQRITEVWPSRFPTIEAAAPYAHNPEALANKVYGGRMGNTEPGDGWRYRGRGLIGVTGKYNYQMLTDLCGVDFVSNPDLLSTPASALLTAKVWWAKKIPFSAVGDVERVTRIVNGGTTGLEDRQRHLAAAKHVLGITEG